MKKAFCVFLFSLFFVNSSFASDENQNLRDLKEYGLFSFSFSKIFPNNSYLEKYDSYFANRVKYSQPFFSFEVCAPVNSFGIYFEFGSLNGNLIENYDNQLIRYDTSLGFIYLGYCKFIKNHFLVITLGVGGEVFEKDLFQLENSKYALKEKILINEPVFLFKVGYGYWLKIYEYEKNKKVKSVGLMPSVEYGHLGWNIKLIIGAKF